MKKIIYILGLLMLVSVVGVSAMNMENSQVCTVTGTILNGNHMGNQIPHFECCDSDGYCRMGDTIFKHLRLQPVGSSMWSDVEADLHANSYDGMDHVSVSLRASGLQMNQVYTVWLMNSNSTETLRVGMFRANKMGRGSVYMKQTVMDFNDFNEIVVMNSNMTVLSGDLTFTTTMN